MRTRLVVLAFLGRLFGPPAARFRLATAANVSRRLAVCSMEEGRFGTLALIRLVGELRFSPEFFFAAADEKNRLK